MSERAQLVLIASVMIAVALVPITFAYLQLGYAADVDRSLEVTDPEADAHRVLVRAVHDASESIPERFAWSRRDGAAASVRSSLSPRFTSIETSSIERGIARSLQYNDTAATAWAAENCPRGPNRQFGPCDVDDGIVLQQRAGRTHVLRIAVDLETSTARRTSSVTWLIEAW